jgi:hypothetical protein
LAHGQADQQDTDPRGDPADNFRICSAKQQAEIFAGKIAEHPAHFQADNPAGVQADR